MSLLSVIVPVYNEAKTIRQILEKINSVGVDKEIVVIDDGSSDGTRSILNDIKLPNLKIIHHSSNRGKGAAVLTGLQNSKSEFVIIQDADLEYDPNDYLKLIEEIRQNHTDIALGVRFTKGYHGLLIPRIGNRMLAIFMNILFNSRLNDYLTCYKLSRKSTLESLNLQSQRFNIDTEIVTKALRRKLRIKQVSISYHPRSYAEGKKIRILDGIHAIFTIIKYRFFVKD